MHSVMLLVSFIIHVVCPKPGSKTLNNNGGVAVSSFLLLLGFGLSSRSLRASGSRSPDITKLIGVPQHNLANRVIVALLTYSLKPIMSRGVLVRWIYG